MICLGAIALEADFREGAQNKMDTKGKEHGCRGLLKKSRTRLMFLKGIIVLAACHLEKGWSSM